MAYELGRTFLTLHKCEIMAEKAIMSFKPNRGLVTFLICGGIACCWPTILFCDTAFVDGCPQLVSIIMSGFFGAFALMCFVTAYFLGPLLLYSDRIIKYSIFRMPVKTIFLDEITSWEEVENESESGTRQITIRAQSKKIKITSWENGYEDLKKYLTNTTTINPCVVDNTANKKIRQDRDSNWINRIGFFVLIALCSWMAYAGLHAYFYPNDELDNLAISEIVGVASATPEIHIGAKSSRYITIKLKGYPDYTFSISSTGFDATAKNDLHFIQSDDSVFLSISESDYKKKITKEKALTFWDKINSSKVIWVCELYDEKYGYLTLENYKIAKIEDGKWGIYIAIPFIGAILWAIWQLHKLSKTKHI